MIHSKENLPIKILLYKYFQHNLTIQIKMYLYYLKIKNNRYSLAMFNLLLLKRVRDKLLINSSH